MFSPVPRDRSTRDPVLRILYGHGLPLHESSSQRGEPDAFLLEANGVAEAILDQILVERLLLRGEVR